MRFDAAWMRWLAPLALITISGCGGSGTAASSGSTGTVTGAALFAEATASGVRLTWGAKTFTNPGTPVAYQIYRSDILRGASVPVMVTDATTTQVVDDTNGNPSGIHYSSLTTPSTNSTCVSTYGDISSGGAIPGVELGRPYTYRIVQVFDLKTTKDQCYFQDEGILSQTVTPLAMPTPTAPAKGAKASGTTDFVAQGVAGNYTITLEYVLQFSTSASFPADVAETYTFAPQQQTGKGASTVTFSVDPSASYLPAHLLSASTVYWRIGAKNVADAPGPVADGGLHYIFSVGESFTR